jgi:RNA polymerase sigma-54 factor
MAIGPRLDLRQSQSLVMTPQLQQAIRLLALSNLEIESFIAEELEKNPLLEAGAEEGPPETPPADATESDGGGEADEPPTADRLIETGDALDDSPLDVNYDAETFHHDSAADSARGMDGGLSLDGAAASGHTEDGTDFFETVAAAETTLHDHLLAQAGACLSGRALFIAGHLIDQIDEAGYLATSLLDLSQRLGAPLVQLEQVLATIQSFDPTGVGARSLAECLALQAKEVDRYDPAMARLIDNLELLARGALPQLRRICGVDEEDLADMIRELRAYDPKPGQGAHPGSGPRHLRPAHPRGLGDRAQLGDAPPPARQPGLLCRAGAGPTGQGQPRLAFGMPRQRQLAGEGARPAGAHDHQGRDRAGEAAGSLLPQRRRASPPAHPARGRRCDRDA